MIFNIRQMQKIKDTLAEVTTHKSLIASIALKISSAMGNLFNGSSARAELASGGNDDVYAKPEKMSTHSAIIELLNKGKNYDQAEQIVQITEDYQLELATLNTNNVQVFGKSVWIDLED